MKWLPAISPRSNVAPLTVSLRAYLVAVILVAAVPIALLMALQIYRDVESQRARVEDELGRTATALAQGVERELASTADALTILAQSEALQSGDPERFRRRLDERGQLRSSWHGVYLSDRHGETLFDTADNAPLREERGGMPVALPRVLAEMRPVVSGLARRQAGGGYATAVEVPVEVGGVPRYVLGAWIDSSVWQQMIDQAARPQRAFAGLFDNSHRIIARSLNAQRSIGQRLPETALAAMRGRPSGVMRTELPEGGEAYVAWQTVATAGWGVATGLSALPLEAAQREAMITAGATALGCLLLGTALALLLAERVRRPLHRLASQGAALPPARIRVREIAILRDALLAASERDETARSRLKTKADEFETLFNSSPIALAFAQDPQCRVVLHNAAMDQLFGPHEGEGVPALRVLRRGRELERNQQPLQVAAAEGRTVNAMELEVLVEGRAPTYVIATAVPLLDLAGQSRGAIGAVIDISERKRAEERLLAADQRLRESQRLVDLAQEAGHVGFFHYRFDRDALSWTAGQAKLFDMGDAPPESTLDEWVQRIHPDDRISVGQALREIFAQRRETATLEFRVLRADGSERWLSARMLMTYRDDGMPLRMVGISVDISDQKVAERQRIAITEREQAARKDAEAANRAKDEFLAMLGHELRNPLSAISSAVEVLKRVEGNTEIALNARSIIDRQTRHLAHLMDDLLDGARVISGKISLSRAPLNLATLVRRLSATLQLTGAAKAHTLDVSLQEVWIHADATRIEQVLNNLLTNAVKYTPEGGRIEVALRSEGAEAVLEVRDSGVGIPATLLPHVFELFVQGDRTLDRRAGGLGVGLTLVRRLVELHGGRVAAQSSPDGSVFTVRLPAIEAPQRPAEQHFVPASKRRRVAVIEDNEDALQALRSMLELDGHIVSTASDGTSGLAAVLEQRPDVAIVDIGLPGLTGFEVAKRSRAAGYAGNMIAISGYGQGGDIQKALASGFDAHLVKPVDAQHLRELLAEC